MSTGPNPNFFGRVQPAPDQWGSVVAGVGMAPEIAGAPPPPKSPKLWRARYPRYRGQLIGCCVGESGASMLETLCRCVHPIVADPPATVDGTPMFSALWVYYAARRYSAQQGRPLRGEGAIVTDALAAILRDGVIAYGDWPSTEANYRNYNDRNPPKGVETAKRYKVNGEGLRLTSMTQVQDYLARGYSVWFGGPWRGGTATARDGSFTWNRGVLGGHAVELLAYDTDADRLVIGNSWDNAGWGVQPNADSGLPRGYGYCPWSQFKQDLGSEDFGSGAVEAVVITGLDWGQPTPDPVPVPPTPIPPPDPPKPTPDPTPTPADISGTFIMATGEVYRMTGKRIL